jgi:hypothetical protein
MDDPDGWLTLAEGARRLGVSLDTLRRRVKRDQVEARKVPTRNGPAWRVRVDLIDAPWPDAAPAVATDLTQLVRDILEQNARLAEEVGSLRAQLAAARADGRRRPRRERAGRAD